VIVSFHVAEKRTFPVETLAAIEDRLFPRLGMDVWERALYHHLLRHTRLLGTETVLVAIAPVGRATGMSEWKVREVIRSMARKGCIRIEDRGRSGHVVRVVLPDEIDGMEKPGAAEEPIDIEAIDCFTDRRQVLAIVAREEQRCFLPSGADARVRRPRSRRPACRGREQLPPERRCCLPRVQQHEAGRRCR
jgi:hypothetical protein